MGGPIRWPNVEPWPHCTDAHPGTRYAPPRGAGPVPLVPVVQLLAADVPELPFPDGTDVLQVLWCPYSHEEHCAPRPQVYWWDGSRTDLEPADPPRPDGAHGDYLPEPCVLHPERITESPSWDLPEELYDRLQDRFEQVEDTPAVGETWELPYEQRHLIQGAAGEAAVPASAARPKSAWGGAVEADRKARSAHRTDSGGEGRGTPGRNDPAPGGG